MNIEVIRIENSYGETLGVLTENGELRCVTLELPDRNNSVSISRIPEGVYACKRVISLKFGDTFQVMDVPGRTNILFHAGNTSKDTHGCILLGNHYGGEVGERAILNSLIAFTNFKRRHSKIDQFTLTIRSV